MMGAASLAPDSSGIEYMSDRLAGTPEPDTRLQLPKRSQLESIFIIWGAA